LTDVLRQGARTLLAQAIEAEVATFLASMPSWSASCPSAPSRPASAGCRCASPGPDRGPVAAHARFTSSILPRYLHRTRSLEEFLPWLYLKGISSGDFAEALAALAAQPGGSQGGRLLTRARSS
jgi:putative transposase